MVHRSLATSLVMAMTAAVAMPYAQSPAASPSSLVGAWTLNHDLSDKPQDRSAGDGREGGQGGRRGGGFGGGRRRGGGFGGGGFGGGNATDGRKPEDVQRMRSALRDEMQAPEHLTITQSGTTVIMTAGDGRTMRFSTDGKKIKDESTKSERKTTWEAGKLVSEIKGLGQGTITETYGIDAEHQLHVTLRIDAPQRKTTLNRVYDADPK
jgi:hypothetical protein